MDRAFELKLADGQVVQWEGRDGVDASRRYANAHLGATVIAWRHPRTALQIGVDPARIVEPGHPLWGKAVCHGQRQGA